METLDKRPLVHCGCPCGRDTRLRALIGGQVAGRAPALMRHSGQPANHSAGSQVLPPPIARQRAPAARPFRLIVHCPCCYPTSRALACCFWAFWEAAPAAPPLLPFCRFVALSLCSLCSCQLRLPLQLQLQLQLPLPLPLPAASCRARQ